MCMKNIFIKSTFIICGIVLFNSCATMYTAPYTPEETGIGITKITDENISVVAGLTSYSSDYYYTPSRLRTLSISPKGDGLAFISIINNQQVACTRDINAVGNQMTQRTFRPTYSLSWGSDDKIYFGDDSYYNYRPICSVNARSGSIMKQHTNNSSDCNPILSKDGKKLFFQRDSYDGSSSIWCYDLSTSSLLLCCSGTSPYPIDKNGKKILCCRKNGSTYGIWIVDYEKGEESILISNETQNYVSPTLSPDGEWVLFTGNTYSPISKKEQLDIFCIKMDGSQFTRLTSHPAQDQCPVWSSDGKYIYFISNRTSERRLNSIWRMNFTL